MIQKNITNLFANMETRKITCTIEVDCEIYIFSIQRDSNGEASVTSSPNLPRKIQHLIDDLWVGHALTTL